MRIIIKLRAERCYILWGIIETTNEIEMKCRRLEHHSVTSVYPLCRNLVCVCRLNTDTINRFGVFTVTFQYHTTFIFVKLSVRWACWLSNIWWRHREPSGTQASSRRLLWTTWHRTAKRGGLRKLHGAGVELTNRTVPSFLCIAIDWTACALTLLYKAFLRSW